jgi:4-amino-4-deoxy-L-arabinose transferase-like glycosyltransferase
VRALLRSYPRFFLFSTLAALGLRLLFLFRFPGVSNDSAIYADIARNWLAHGSYAITDGGVLVPTYIRLPGYPAFLAAIFAIFGVEHYRAVLLVQVCVDLGTCFLIADLARRAIGDRAAKAAFLLAALCPFFANYAAAVLAETLEIFFTALALDLAVAGLEGLRSRRLLPWIGCGLSIGGAMLLRPDGGLLLAAIGLYLLWRLAVAIQRGSGWAARSLVAAGLLVGCFGLLPLAPWTLRNLHTMHRFQPLAPRYANEENEVVPAGFNRWMKTWILDYVSTEEVYWNVPGDKVDAGNLPARAFDTPQEKEATVRLLEDYDQTEHVTPDLDARFAALAAQRIHHDRLRYYVWLPLGRIADMWLRPRTALLPSDTRWWEFNDDPVWLTLGLSLGVVNLLYIAAALAGLVKGRPVAWLGLLLTFVVLRSAFLGTLENPEPRYTLECYPVVVVLAAAWFARKTKASADRPAAPQAARGLRP